MIKKVLRNSIVYIGFDVLNKSIPFLLLPIMTKYLSPTEYGILASYQALVAFFIIAISLDTYSGLGVNYYKLSKEELKKYISALVTISLLTSFLLLFVVIILNLVNFLPELFNFEFYVLAVCISLLSVFGQIILILYRFSENPVAFGTINFVSVLTGTAVSLYLIILLGYGWEGRAYGMLMGITLIAFFLFKMMYQENIKLNIIDAKYIKDALIIGLPLLPHALAGFIKNGADRFILISLIGISSVGIYSVSFQIATVIMVLASGINMAWSPYLYKQLSFENCNKEQLVKYSYFIMVAFFLFTFIYLFIIEVIFSHFINISYASGMFLAQLISLAFSLEIIYYMFVNFLFYAKKTIYVSYSTFLSAAVYFLFLYILTPDYGINGIGIALVLSYIVSTISVIAFSVNIYKMPWLTIWRVK
ncbi:oligosaccharide flippase family protein [Aliarcobacter cryaerophilus]|uniref:oligosaccharide flippase family protein n=1 Tax=Aliarcobacter cryaerophilus TaxID=28198 RepID=UPI0021B5F07D|nr:oligosaccharide flippase family protein [Aliarcobacter cryaerophilus]MCT7487116.1 oligosaccharide flippase family protein [Aliarcobacter cryaerophilus]MCT7491570.1 oligosaccharide flippase family protein [Aliarcobacter cryaerophilus]